VGAKNRDGDLEVVSPHIGLHPLVRVFTGILGMTKFEAKQISCKIKVDFERDLMFLQSYPVCDIITKQIQEVNIHLVCQEFVQKDPPIRQSKKSTIH
jgi:hypothetical protein